jgi:hypothetical protein
MNKGLVIGIIVLISVIGVITAAIVLFGGAGLLALILGLSLTPKVKEKFTYQT